MNSDQNNHDPLKKSSSYKIAKIGNIILVRKFIFIGIAKSMCEVIYAIEVDPKKPSSLLADLEEIIFG